MKKVLVLLSIMMLGFTLSACEGLGNNVDTPVVCEEGYELDTDGKCVAIDVTDPTDPTDPDEDTCPTGQELDNDGNCVDVVDTCPAGQEFDEDGNCVVKELTCETGNHVEDGVCVPDDETETLRRLVIDAIVDEMDGNPMYLGTVMQDMTFTQGMKIEYNVDLEVEIDFDAENTNNLSVTIIDTMVDNMLQREVSMTVDEETISFAVYYEAVENGVHVYVQPSMLKQYIDIYSSEELIDYMNWIGFDNEWVVFEFDETLENMIELDVLQDMMSALFFKEVGEDFFYMAQDEIEAELGFSLEDYGVNVGSWVDLYLAEEYEQLNADLNLVDPEGIMLEIDYRYISYEFRHMVASIETELRDATFDYDLYYPLLMVSEYDDMVHEVVLIDGVVVDGTMGTVAFFDALTPEQRDIFFQVLEDEVRDEIHYLLTDAATFDSYYSLKYFFENHETEFEAAFPTRYNVVYGAIVANQGELFDAYNFFMNVLTAEEKAWLYDNLQSSYELYIYYDLEEYVDLQEAAVEFLQTHEARLLELGYTDIQGEITTINTLGFAAWVDGLNGYSLDILVTGLVNELEADLMLAQQNGEVLEFVMNKLFSDPHLRYVFGMAPVPFDYEAFADVMVEIDWTAIQSETMIFDQFQEMFDAIHDGGVAYEAFLSGLSVNNPNTALLYGMLTPAVYQLEQYMYIADEVIYGYTNLELFDDFIDPMYYMDNIVTVTAETTDDIELLVEAEINGVGYATLFNDFASAYGTYMTGFETIPFPYTADWQCIEGFEYCTAPDLEEVRNQLLELGPLTIQMLMDPNNPSWMSMNIDASELFTSIALMNIASYEEYMQEDDPDYVYEGGRYEPTNITATFSVSVTEVATLVTPAPEDTNSMNDIVVNFAKFEISNYAVNVLQNAANELSMLEPTELASLLNNPMYLTEFDSLMVSEAFDADLSYVVLTGVINPLDPSASTLDYELVLYWVDGTLVFTDGIALSDFMNVFEYGFVTEEAVYDMMVALVDDTTFSMTKVWLMQALEQEDYEKEYVVEYMPLYDAEMLWMFEHIEYEVENYTNGLVYVFAFDSETREQYMVDYLVNDLFMDGEYDNFYIVDAAITDDGPHLMIDGSYQAIETPSLIIYENGTVVEIIEGVMAIQDYFGASYY